MVKITCKFFFFFNEQYLQFVTLTIVKYFLKIARTLDLFNTPQLYHSSVCPAPVNLIVLHYTCPYLDAWSINRSGYRRSQYEISTLEMKAILIVCLFLASSFFIASSNAARDIPIRGNESTSF